MYCPRCGRPVNPEANFCGGCGLSKVEIEKYLSRTAPQQEVAEPVVEVAEPVAEPVVEPVVEVAPQQEAPAEETPVAEPVFAEPEQVKAEDTQPQQNNCTYSYCYKKAEPAQPAAESAPKAAEPAVAQTEKPEPKLEKPMSTVDFVCMMLIAAIPVVGMVYIIYLALQNNNTNKRSYARATIIMAAFGLLLSALFALGVASAGLF